MFDCPPANCTSTVGYISIFFRGLLPRGACVAPESTKPLFPCHPTLVSFITLTLAFVKTSTGMLPRALFSFATALISEKNDKVHDRLSSFFLLPLPSPFASACPSAFDIPSSFLTLPSLLFAAALLPRRSMWATCSTSSRLRAIGPTCANLMVPASLGCSKFPRMIFLSGNLTCRQNKKKCGCLS